MVKKTKEDAIDTGANMVDMEHLMKRCEELQHQVRALKDEMMVMRTSLTVGRATVKWFKGQAFDHDHYSLMIKYKTRGGHERDMTLIRGRELDEVTRQIGELSDDLQGLFEMITNEILDE